VVKITPPGPLRPAPTLLQQEVRRIATPPPPSYQELDDPYDFDESDDDDDAKPAHQEERSLREDVAVPEFWGVVRVNDFNGVPRSEGLERDNSMHNMLLCTAYWSQRTNTVYVGESASEAKNYERRNNEAPHNAQNENNNQTYVRAHCGLPLNPSQVKQLRTMYRDQSGRFRNRERAEAYLLL
jgi:hypothetical protein